MVFVEPVVRFDFLGAALHQVPVCLGVIEILKSRRGDPIADSLRHFSLYEQHVYIPGELSEDVQVFHFVPKLCDVALVV